MQNLLKKVIKGCLNSEKIAKGVSVPIDDIASFPSKPLAV